MERIVVPVFKQVDDVGCGATCLSMLCKHFGKNISEKQIIKRMDGLFEDGSIITNLALVAREIGFNVICYSYNLEYFNPKYIKYSRTKFIQRLNNIISLVDSNIALLDALNAFDLSEMKKKSILYKHILESTLAVLKTDIKFKMKMPCLKDITDFLDKKLPVMVFVKSAIFYEIETDLKRGHFIVLTGYTKMSKVFSYNDPEDGRKKHVSFDKLFFALSSHAIDHSGYLLVIH